VGERVLTVRGAVERDGEAIGEAHAAAWLAAYANIFTPDFLSAAASSRRRGWPRAMSSLLAPPNVLLVGELDGRVVAFAHAAPSAESARVGEICGFYCHPEAWGSGISKSLMAQTRSALVQDFDRVVLWTARDAHRARRFYAKVGFASTGRERLEVLTDWSTGAAADAPAVEYTAPL
jgi:GNAT superfamily N-acetyltransferase